MLSTIIGVIIFIAMSSITYAISLGYNYDHEEAMLIAALWPIVLPFAILFGSIKFFGTKLYDLSCFISKNRKSK